MPGPVALVGSGEYLPVMAALEAGLMAGRPSRYVQLPTAAGMESPSSIARWIALGADQAARLGVEAVPVKVLDRESAEDAANAKQIKGAGLIYLSGGNPAYLADTLRGSLVWVAIVEEWQKGAALAGCSAGAMALTGRVPNIRRPEAEPRVGLGAVPKLWVLPHFDRLQGWAPRDGRGGDLSGARRYDPHWHRRGDRHRRRRQRPQPVGGARTPVSLGERP